MAEDTDDIITIHMPAVKGFTEAQIEQLEDAYVAGLVVVLGGTPGDLTFPINTQVQTIVVGAAASPDATGRQGTAQSGETATDSYEQPEK